MNSQAHNFDATASQVTAQLVDDASRMGTLARYFGDRAVRFEAAVFDFMRRFSADYGGGFWQFYELNNGGFYMAPDHGSYRLSIDSNGYEGAMSADAAGITVCLFACSHLSFQDALAADLFGQRFHQLRQYAMEYPEAAQIFAAID